jgi:transcriptional regulator with XRE-family HTH domain
MTTLDARTAEILQLYRADGWTYQQLATKFGLTRQRIQQIIKKGGGVDYSKARILRQQKRTAAQESLNHEFDAKLGAILSALLKEEVDPTEIARRLQLLGRPVTEDQVRQFANRHSLPVATAQPHLYADVVLRLAVWAAAATSLDIEEDVSEAFRIPSVELAQLVSATVSPEEAAEAAQLVARARRNRAALTLTKDSYEDWRSEWLKRHPKTELYPWPVTALTIMTRLGGGFWNEAMREVGLNLNIRGRPRGRVFYTGEDDYERAVGQFVSESVDGGFRPTTEDYDRWAYNRPVPSLGALRVHFGSWTRALRVGLDVSGRRLPDRKALGVTLEADRLIDIELELLERLFQEAGAQLDGFMPKPQARQLIKKTTSELTGDLVTTFESFRRRWLVAAVKEQPQGFVDNLSPAGKARPQEHRAWSSVQGQRPVREVIEIVIEERSLDSLLSATRGDLRDDGGWLAAPQRARLLRIDSAESARWRVLKAARNVLEHQSMSALGVLASALRSLDDEADALLVLTAPPNSPANVLRWLSAEVGAPAEYAVTSWLDKSRLGHLHRMLARVTKSMRSTSLGSAHEAAVGVRSDPPA